MNTKQTLRVLEREAGYRNDWTMAVVDDEGNTVQDALYSAINHILTLRVMLWWVLVFSLLGGLMIGTAVTVWVSL